MIAGYIEESLSRIDTETACADCDTNTHNDSSTETSNNADSQNSTQIPVQGCSTQPDLDDIRKKRLAFLSKLDNSTEMSTPLSNGSANHKESKVPETDPSNADGMLLFFCTS